MDLWLSSLPGRGTLIPAKESENTMRGSVSRFLALSAFLLAVLLSSAASQPSRAGAASSARVLPEFGEDRPSYWLNSVPLRVVDLHGRVLLVEVWTFGCGNCVRTIPWIRELDARYAERGLLVLGVHSPEFRYERDLGRVRTFVARSEIDFPVLLDNDHRYWKSLDNRYWPTIYLVDREGRIRHVHVGEVHSGTERAAEVEAMIEELLAEDP